jgi:hypothetical protein
VKVYKLDVMIIDHDGLGEEGIKEELENVRFPNDCLRPIVLCCQSRDIEWSDNHPLNITKKTVGEGKKLFGVKP